MKRDPVSKAYKLRIIGRRDIRFHDHIASFIDKKQPLTVGFAMNACTTLLYMADNIWASFNPTKTAEESEEADKQFLEFAMDSLRQHRRDSGTN